MCRVEDWICNRPWLNVMKKACNQSAHKFPVPILVAIIISDGLFMKFARFASYPFPTLRRPHISYRSNFFSTLIFLVRIRYGDYSWVKWHKWRGYATWTKCWGKFKWKDRKIRKQRDFTHFPNLACQRMRGFSINHSLLSQENGVRMAHCPWIFHPCCYYYTVRGHATEGRGLS